MKNYKDANVASKELNLLSIKSRLDLSLAEMGIVDLKKIELGSLLYLQKMIEDTHDALKELNDEVIQAKWARDDC